MHSLTGLTSSRRPSQVCHQHPVRQPTDENDSAIYRRNCTTGSKTTLATSAYTVEIDYQKAPTDKCASTANTDLSGNQRVPSCSQWAKSCLPAGATQADCCAGCTAAIGCKAWIYDPSAKNCWLMASGGTPVAHADRVSSAGQGVGISASVSTPDGTLLWSAADLSTHVGQNLNWPAPTSASAYAIKDFPRFFVPAWAATPVGEKSLRQMHYFTHSSRMGRSRRTPPSTLPWWQPTDTVGVGRWFT
jgi:hypothetical protein